MIAHRVGFHNYYFLIFFLALTLNKEQETHILLKAIEARKGPTKVSKQWKQHGSQTTIIKTHHSIRPPQTL